MKIEMMKCQGCGIIFEAQTKLIKYKLKIKPDAKFFCSKECATESAKTKIKKNCANCTKEILVCPSDVTPNNFCNRSCSVTYNNKFKSRKDKTKDSSCTRCGVISTVARNARWVCKNFNCKDYVPGWSDNRKQKRISRQPTEKNCKKCNGVFLAKYSRYCEPCMKVVRKEGAMKSVEKQNRRSRNEIYFSELCTERYENVSTNKPIFEGWDADVILETEKIAILWNGNWHYQPIYKERSLLQIQTRDRLKVAAIKRCGYTPYIVKDRGQYKKKFVEEQFDIFEKYAKNKRDGIITDPLQEVISGHLDDL